MEGLPTSPITVDPLLSLPFILVRGPTASPPLLPSSPIVSLSSLSIHPISLSCLPAAYFTLLSPVCNFAFSSPNRRLSTSTRGPPSLVSKNCPSWRSKVVSYHPDPSIQKTTDSPNPKSPKEHTGRKQGPAHCPLLPAPSLTVRTQTTSVAAVGPWVPPRRASAAKREGRSGPGRRPGP